MYKTAMRKGYVLRSYSRPFCFTGGPKFSRRFQLEVKPRLGTIIVGKEDLLISIEFIRSRADAKVIEKAWDIKKDKKRNANIRVAVEEVANPGRLADRFTMRVSADPNAKNGKYILQIWGMDDESGVQIQEVEVIIYNPQKRGFDLGSAGRSQAPFGTGFKAKGSGASIGDILAFKSGK